jgi:hypothetical protein
LVSLGLARLPRRAAGALLVVFAVTMVLPFLPVAHVPAQHVH